MIQLARRALLRAFAVALPLAAKMNHPRAMKTALLNVRVGDVSLATQSFGVSTDPAIILAMGATASMLGWPDEYCDGLARQGFFVIRYDHRDTGLSTTYAPGSPPYAVEDLASDLLAILDAHGVGRAHVVGMSLGGFIAQIAALTAPYRVMTLTLIGSEPLGWDGEALPNIAPTFLEHFAGLEQLDWSSDDQVRAFLFKIEQLCAGSGIPFDATRARARVNAVMARSPRLASAFNHGAAQLRGDWSGRFRGITQPTLVIHGEDDPILPVQNGRALAYGIRGARLVTLAGVGHELPRQSLPVIVGEITSLSKLAAP